MTVFVECVVSCREVRRILIAEADRVFEPEGNRRTKRTSSKELEYLTIFFEIKRKIIHCNLGCVPLT